MSSSPFDVAWRSLVFKPRHGHASVVFQRFTDLLRYKGRVAPLNSLHRLDARPWVGGNKDLQQFFVWRAVGRISKRLTGFLLFGLSSLSNRLLGRWLGLAHVSHRSVNEFCRKSQILWRTPGVRLMYVVLANVYTFQHKRKAVVVIRSTGFGDGKYWHPLAKFRSRAILGPKIAVTVATECRNFCHFSRFIK